MNFPNTAKLIVATTILSIGCTTNEQKPAATPSLVAPQSAAVAVAPPEEPVNTHPLTIKYRSTGSIEASASHAAFGEFDVTATDDVADAKLILRGSHSGEIREAVGAPFETTGTGIAVDLGNLAAGEQRRVIVAFELDRESMHFNAETSYQDLHQPGRPAVISASSRHSASRGMKSAEVYKNVRLAYSEQAIDTVEQYIEDKNYDQALAWVEDAYTTNVDVGMAMRISSKLSGPQDELAALRDEVEELRRPKKVRRPKKKAPQIIMTFGDRDS